ncbi:PfkB family carbohydrate kinase [Kineococcus aurantiacus]|uniref:RfaE bifunctional protein nucleotidyltransferase chain/domain/rfaE bifunctional protein kinase chain/domain n=1 Tax=Kineococcus aurantiacus TaxID=37633 RepID=A0A7Y9DN98_9ACTN|nr:rfaE bifunctional protein nucleotidyltransferase chain/domain/rfaE bifunctional protein kinase chain/domain [Kineococcus aurantiacus]
MKRVVVVGDALLDREVVGSSSRLAPDAPVPVVDVEGVRESPGGAALTALLAALDPSVTVALVAPLADDAAGRRLRDLLPGIEVHALPHEGPTRTKSRVRTNGHVLARLDEGGPGTPGGFDPGVLDGVLDGADVVLVSDYGAGTTRDPRVRAALAAVAGRVPVVWDPHPRGGAPVPGTALVTPNLAEARAALGGANGGADGGGDPGVTATRLRERWDVRSVCVTAGADGAYCASGGEVLHLPAVPAAGDPCGAGDRFAATCAVEVARGSSLSQALDRAVRDASAWVAGGGTTGFFADSPVPAPPAPAARTGAARAGGESAAGVVARVRAAGGTVVATGGCFDVLHAGHVGCLEAARGLGDALVVLLNSDASVRRLKGPDRPVVEQGDRERVLRALASVDAVVVFEEDDPQAALADLRPDVWVKGGDYAELPEGDLVRSWGGGVVLLPYLDGRSTTGILGRIG